MARMDYFLRETASGLRRNGIVAFAAMSTAFIALFLFGLSLLIYREFNLVIENLTGNVEVAVYLTDPVNPDTVARLTEELQKLPAVGAVTFESKQEAYQKFLELYKGQPLYTENVRPEVIPASLRVKLTDTAQFGQVTAALGCSEGADGNLTCTAPGVENVADYRDLLGRLTSITRLLSLGVLALAAVMLISAVLLIANTLRMGMFSRRKEIGIMRLVGATNWRIRVPFMIEGLVESLVGASLAVLGLFVVKVGVIDPLRGKVQFFPFVENTDLLAISPWILIAAVAIAFVAGTIGMRRFLDV
ncbi:MAG: permease-like cell division protein FtsX [Actinomycetota bacterium]